MWDERIEDPMWTQKLPFERDAFTYIEIIPSDLLAQMIESTANLVTRGKGQSLALDPYLYSYDPDFPELRVCFYFLSFNDGVCFLILYFKGQNLLDLDYQKRPNCYK